MNPEQSDEQDPGLRVRRSVEKMEIEDAEVKPGLWKKIKAVFRRRKKRPDRMG